MLDIIGIAAIAIIFIGLFVLIVFAGLSDEQRYGIDESGNAKTPKYMAEKKAREEWYEVFNRLGPD